jgi:hypothetical protein
MIVRGSIKVEGDKVMVYQGDDTWAEKGSPDDLFTANLTSYKEDDKITGMAKTLIPYADKWLDNEMNVLLIGLHGTGKTVSIMDLAEQRNLKMKYFSCSTLDPFTDLVGVPVPTPVLDAEGNDTGEQTLKMIRPHEIDEADIIFFDELNRADAKTLNAVFEIIQFHSINGEPLKNLKCCWGAINPPDEDYDVERLDAALLDRFDLYINIDPKPSISYMSKFVPVPIAKALHRWWAELSVSIKQGKNDVKSDYVSPRRLLKIGLVWMANPNARSVQMALPPGGNFNTNALVTYLRAAQEHVDRGVNNEIAPEDEDDHDPYGEYQGMPLGAKPWDGINYDAEWMRLNNGTVIDFLKANPTHYETQAAVAKVFERRHGASVLVKAYGEIMNALSPSTLEGLITGWPDAKKSMMRQAMKDLHKDNSKQYAKLDNLRKVLDPDGKGLVP